MKSGLRQCGVLFAYLITFYINSIMRDVSDMLHGCKLAINKLNIQVYADDLMVFCPTANRLQHSLNRLFDFLAHYELLVNTNTTEVMVFRKYGYSYYRAAPFLVKIN